MGLIVPTPGINGDPGPDYANNQNQDLAILDVHDHSPGRGVQITPSGLNINSNLPFNGNDITTIYGIGFSSPGASTQTAFLYTNSQSGGGLVDLFYNDGAGNVIALTKAGTVNATIASLPGESYSGGTFTWKQGAGSTTPANFDIGSITLRPNTAGTTNGVTLSPPSGISSAYDQALPLNPSVTSYVTIDSSGNMLSTIPITANISTSASCGVFNTTSVSPVTVTNLTVSITTKGNPVMVIVGGDNSTATSSIELLPISSTISNAATLNVLNGATVLNSWGITTFPDVGSSSTQIIEIPASFQLVDSSVIGAPGTYTYTIQAQTSGGQLTVNNVTLTAYEMK